MTTTTFTVCAACDRAVSMAEFEGHRCEPMQPRERSVLCWTHQLTSWRPDARCPQCLDELLS